MLEETAVMEEMAPPVDRFVRQQGLVPKEKLASVKVTVIGVGAIGRQLALQLAAIGVRDIQLIDFDTVELVNTTNQMYLGQDVGKAKVDATKEMIEKIDSTVKVEVVNDRFRVRQKVGEAAFCCVDSMSARDAVWRALRERCAFWIDGRMMGEVMRIIAADSPETKMHYATTLFSDDEAEPGRCTARSTVYTSGIAAGLMTHQFTRWLRGIPVDKDIQLSLLSSEMSST